jgi:prepilin-type N-terminal cleavage/methylation domain-containing protein
MDKARRQRGERGTTLIELIAALALGAILIGLSFGAIRHFWRVNSLEGASGELTSQFRRLQQLAVTGDAGEVYGAVLDLGADSWEAIRFKPTGPGAGCERLWSEPRSLSGGLVGTDFVGAGVKINDVAFEDPKTGAPEATACASLMAGKETVFFYRRGNATGGFVELTQEAEKKSMRVRVLSLTGRVYQL